MSDPHGHHHPPADPNDPHAIPPEAWHIASHMKLYWGIGFALFFLTLVTVWLSYIDFGTPTRNIVIAMAVATFKVSLVGAVFMHLKGERPTIWRFLYFTAFFVAGLFLLTAFHWYDPIWGTSWNEH